MPLPAAGDRVAYLDHAATSPLRPEALAAMMPYLTERFGNPSGSHSVARRARAAVDEAREVVAARVGCDPGEVVFTSGGTEACNMAVAGTRGATGGVVVCSAFEHHAVLDTVAAWGGRTVPVGPDGVVDLDGLEAVLDRDVRLVSVMLANNELGTVQPLAEVVDRVRRSAPGAAVHTDAVAAGAWLDLATEAAEVQLVSLGAHKFGGPKGVGALVVRRGTALAPIMHGGGQERDRRPGTHNVAAIVGMAAALEAAGAHRAEEARRIGSLRDRLAGGLCTAVEGARLTVSGGRRLPGTCHLLFEGVDQEELLVLLDQEGVCASGGSACASGALEPSHVLVALGLPAATARQALRFSAGWSTTDVDVDRALTVVPKAVERLRSG
jgi:cysteine desulfurase